MKILYLNGADNEGGAAKAATRLLAGVRGLGTDAGMYVQRKSGDTPLVRGPRSGFAKAMGYARPTIEQAVLGISPARLDGPFSAAFLPDGLGPLVQGCAPDLVHLHWVARMMRLETLARLAVPLVWTLHDSWAFTGGCYLPGECTRYRENCGNCPVLRSTRANDLSRRVWTRKHKAWGGLDLTLVAPSRAMAECARSSSLFRERRVEVIPNAIDLRRFHPVDRRAAREACSLPQDKKLILFGAKGATTDRNKGFHLLAEALRRLCAGSGCPDTELVVFGACAPDPPPELGVPTRYLGWLSDEASLALLYSAADLFVLPSIQESLGYTAMEAMACGTPCVAFRQGGVPDLIKHRLNGFLATAHDPADLARGMAWVLEDDERRRELSLQARQKVEREFSLESVAKLHISLYRELLNHE